MMAIFMAIFIWSSGFFIGLAITARQRGEIIQFVFISILCLAQVVLRARLRRYCSREQDDQAKKG